MTKSRKELIERIAYKLSKSYEAGRLCNAFDDMSEAEAILSLIETSIEAKYAGVKELVNEQAEDEGLWFEATTAPEAYLQHHLRELHRKIED